MKQFLYPDNACAEEKIYRLKYLFLIDIDTLRDSLLSSPKYIAYKADTDNTEKLKELFDDIFENIFKISKMYNQFLDSNTPYFHTILGIPPEGGDSHYKSNLEKMKSSLFHHCLTHGFLTTLKKTFCDISKLNGPNDSFNQKPFFEYLHTAPMTENANDCYQKSRAHYKALDTRCEKYYSKTCLDTLCKKEPTTHHATYIFLSPIYFKNITRFLLREPSVKNFDRALLNASSSFRFFSRYEELYSAYWKCFNKLKNPKDTFLFQTAFEYLYGFSTIENISAFLAEIYDTKTDSDSFTLKDLEGQQLLHVIVDVLNCPLVHSRSDFFKFACNTLTVSDLEKCYLKFDKFIATARSNKNISLEKSERISLAYTLLNDFFQTLNHFTIPILEDLWDYAISELEKDICAESIHFTADKYEPFCTLLKQTKDSIETSSCMNAPKYVRDSLQSILKYTLHESRFQSNIYKKLFPLRNGQSEDTSPLDEQLSLENARLLTNHLLSKI